MMPRMTAPRRSLLRLAERRLAESRGQALPLAVVALALGSVLIVPLLSGASTDSRFTAQVGATAMQRYSIDAGIEWSGWHLLSNPRLTTDSSFDSAVLQPFPVNVNGAPFPATQIRFVAAAGAVVAKAPVWQGAGGDACYAFSASDLGTLSVRVSPAAGQVWLAVLAAGAPCTRPAGLQPLGGGAPYGADFALAAAGTYQLFVGVSAPAAGTLTMSIPAATYEVRSTSGTRNATARIVAGEGGVRISSWQLN